MGSVYNRGTRSKPNWYVAYKGADGKRHAAPSRQPTKALARRFMERIEARIADGKVGIAPQKEQEPPCATLLKEWADGLRNRAAAVDRKTALLHLLPAFGEMQLSSIDLATVMRWLDEQRAAGYADPTIRKRLSYLSRFFGWAIERGLTESNPVRLIPARKRPAAMSPKRKDDPWLQDEGVVRELLVLLPEPANYMFYLGNRSGMRPGEIVSLRLSDFDELHEGVIRVRFSHDGPLKEDKRNEGKIKWVPAADDCAAFLAPWLSKCRAEGDDPERHVFPSVLNPLERYNTRTLNRQWRKARKRAHLTLTWYQATRHSFASRLSAAGVPIDEIAAALGHSSPAITRQYYDHYIRRSYSSHLRGGLGLGGASAPIPASSPRSKQLQVVGVLGDIHSHDERLACALAQLRTSGVDRILSVGDIVDGPGDLARTCVQLGASDIDVVRGNHERWLLRGEMRHLPDAVTADQISDTERQFLKQLPVVREYATAAGPMLLCHGLGLDDMASVGPDDDVAGNFALQALMAADCYRIVISGHTHRRMVRQVGALTLINAGSLAGPRAGFARIDFAAGEVVYFDLSERDGQLAAEEAERHPL